MSSTLNLNLDYERPIKIADDIYWVGFVDRKSSLQCNPYLIVDGNEAVLIDGGSRPDFPTVMMKILQTGLNPSSIKALIYQHYDPDLCGSIQNLEDIISSKSLRIISDGHNNMFIKHYAPQSEMITLREIQHTFQFSSGRKLTFHNTPYAHSPGSFVTFDEKTGVLFTSDLFSSYTSKWDLFLTLDPECRDCRDWDKCPLEKSHCPMTSIAHFHIQTMTSERALKVAMEVISKIPVKLIAPQHGSVIVGISDTVTVMRQLIDIEGVGIDSITGTRPFEQIGNIEKIIKREAEIEKTINGEGEGED